MKIVQQSATLLAMTPDPLLLLERCGRVCYKSEDKMDCPECGGTQRKYLHMSGQVTEAWECCPVCLERASKFVKGIISRGHEAVLEHASATFLLVTDRGMTHELVRHRLASYSQESTRYCSYGNKGWEISVIEPAGFVRGSDSMKRVWYKSMEAAELAYLDATAEGVEPQWARAVLPTCLKTEIAVTANFRQWRHMMGLRLGNKAGKAHPQIRALFGMILNGLLDTPAACIFEEFKDNLSDCRTS